MDAICCCLHADACVLTFDLTDAKSFDNLESWMGNTAALF